MYWERGSGSDRRSGRAKGLGFSEWGGERVGEERDIFREGPGGGSGEEKEMGRRGRAAEGERAVKG